MTMFTPLQDLLGKDVFQIPGEFDPGRHVHDFTMGAPPEASILGIAYPRSTQEVSEVLKFCHTHDIKVVPQGGMTGMCGGGVPIGPSVVLSLERMREIEEVDPAAGTITCGAGTTLQAVQEAADAADMFFPLDLGGRGTAQVGGNTSTNAGGNRVVRYGMMRALVLGMEWVLADGTVVTSLNKMIKNNAGYDLKHLFIGSEGTLGVITRLVLRCYPKARAVCTGLVAVDDYPAVLALLAKARSGLGSTLSAFEMMWPDFYYLGTEALERRPPIEPKYGVYVLIETMGDDEAGEQAKFEAVIAEAMEAGVVKDAVIATSGQQARDLWAIRDCPGEWTKVYWPQISFDISVSTGQMGAYMDYLKGKILERWPGTRTVFFGHVADSNMHLSVKHREEIPNFEHDLEDLIYATVGEWNGSVSAEHGIGLHKKPYLHHSRTPEELEMMRTLKKALDPKGILNPGKII